MASVDLFIFNRVVDKLDILCKLAEPYQIVYLLTIITFINILVV